MRVETVGLLALASSIAATLLMPPAGRAVGGRYAFAGGTPRQRAEVVRALEASSFPWELVSERITIHIAPGAPSRATPGEIWLDANLLDSGEFAWGVVQHEYAHQVDFFLLDEGARSVLLAEFGGATWCSPAAAVPHSKLGCERFASMLAWAYWPSPENCMRPATRSMPARFRHLLARLIRGA